MSLRLELILLGDPVDHSRSPTMHTAALAAAGLSGSYTARRVDAIGVVEAMTELRRGAVSGANITMPHKVTAASLCDSLSPDAEAAASVNTWVRNGDEVVGHSTDVVGVRELVSRFPDGRVTILGSGGAAAAALVALDGREIDLVARSVANGRRLAEAIGVAAEVHSWEATARPSVVINCTPIGMRRSDALPDRHVGQSIAFLDMAYGVSETRAISAAKARQIPYADGIDLLVAQAEASFHLWTGIIPPAGVMESAARHGTRAGIEAETNLE